MKVICNNPSCTFAKRLKTFDVDALSNSCPSCGVSELLPATALKYKSPKDHFHNSLINSSKDELSKFAKKHKAINKNKISSSSKLSSRPSSKPSSVSSDGKQAKYQTKNPLDSAKSLESIEMSYRSKMQRLSKSIKNDKVMKKFSKMDDDILSSDSALKDLNKELKKIDALFQDFESTAGPDINSKKVNVQDSKKTNKKTDEKANS